MFNTIRFSENACTTYHQQNNQIHKHEHASINTCLCVRHAKTTSSTGSESQHAEGKNTNQGKHVGKVECRWGRGRDKGKGKSKAG